MCKYIYKWNIYQAINLNIYIQMEKNVSVGKWILDKIEEKNLTKTMVYQGAGITQSGFLKMIRSNSMKLEVFESICKAMSVNPCEYLQLKNSKYIQTEYQTSINEPLEELGDKKIDTETKEFYERQIESLTQIILNLSKNGQS